MKEPQLTRDDILAAIAKATRNQPGGEGFRVEDLVELTGRSLALINRTINQGLKNGSVERTEKVIEQRNGVYRKVPAYLFVKHGRPK